MRTSSSLSPFLCLRPPAPSAAMTMVAAAVIIATACALFVEASVVAGVTSPSTGDNIIITGGGGGRRRRIGTGTGNTGGRACFVLRGAAAACRRVDGGTVGGGIGGRSGNGSPSPRPPRSFATGLYSTTERGEKETPSSSSSKVDLPDFGKTPVEVDKIRVEKKKRKRTKIKENDDDDDDDNKNNPWRRTDLFGTSLIDQTMDEMEHDESFQRTREKLREIGLDGMTKEERTQRRRALKNIGVKQDFTTYVRDAIRKHDNEGGEEDDGGEMTKLFDPRGTVKIMQINIGLYCNQACGHCHVESSPLRKEEQMSLETAVQCIRVLKESPQITTVDITGGAPELNEHFRYLVSTIRSLRPDVEIIDRCNLTVLQEPGQGRGLVDFLRRNGVRIVASLPCYSAKNVDQQRGNGVFDRSISALLALNEAGYGREGTGLVLDLVYNPLGAFLPPEQTRLELQYKRELRENFGITFNSLFTMTNMPIKRFADFLYRRDELQDYMELLVRNFNVHTVRTAMCIDTVSIGYDGSLYDCDFNQQLGYNILKKGGGGDDDEGTAKPPTPAPGLSIYDVESMSDLEQTYKIRHDNHCFGCTSGMGSS